MTLTGRWASPELGVPPGAHFTTFLGMVHTEKAFIWKTGMVASPGTELLAETGNGLTMLQEIDSMVRNRTASSLLLFTAPAPTGVKSTSFYCNSNYSQVSFASMLGDTPDWFTGLSGFHLRRDNTWVTDTTILLPVYDAGTEEGLGFSSNNPATDPAQPVRLLSATGAPVLANGKAVIGPVATVRFTKR